MDELRKWIRVAATVRATCLNVREFDLLIQYQKQRLNGLEGKSTAIPESKMATFDVFISHSSKNKELARFTYYNAISNDLRPWFDEALLSVGDDMKPAIRKAIADSGAYVLFHTKEAMSDKSWVPF